VTTKLKATFGFLGVMSQHADTQGRFKLARLHHILVIQRASSVAEDDHVGTPKSLDATIEASLLRTIGIIHSESTLEFTPRKESPLRQDAR
jgi:hypothetical protein